MRLSAARESEERAMHGIEFDDRRWPILVVTFTGDHSEKTTEQFMQGMEGYYERREPFAMIVKIDSYRAEDVRLIKRVAMWYMEHQEAFEEFGCGLALVPPSESFRFVLSTFMVIAPIPDHYTVAKNLDEALAWVESRMETNKPPTPA
jgi:hypothetical protein